MVLLRKFDRRICDRTAAKIPLAQIFAHPGHDSAELRVRIAGIRPYGFFVPGDRSGIQATQIFRNQAIFRFEVAIQRHLVGLRRRGDLIDADRADATRIKQLAGGVQDALPRRNGRLCLRPIE